MIKYKPWQHNQIKIYQFDKSTYFAPTFKKKTTPTKILKKNLEVLDNRF